MCVLGVWVVTVGIGLWLYAHSRDVEVMVQTVVYNAEGQFVSLGVPQKLLEYEPEDGQWRDMLEEWVHKKQWRSDEPSATLARANWAWVYKHTCGDATKRLEQDEQDEKPFQAGKITRSVKVRSTTKTPTPQSFRWCGKKRPSTKPRRRKTSSPIRGPLPWAATNRSRGPTPSATIWASV